MGKVHGVWTLLPPMCWLAAHFCFCNIEEDGGFVTQASKGEGLTVNHPPPPL